MNNCLKKEIICSYKPGDWFDRIPLAHLCDGGITAINVDRRFGKSTFVANAAKKILSQDMADIIVVECGGKNRIKLMKTVFKEVFGDNFEKQYPQIEIRPHGNRALSKRRTVIFIDEFSYTATDDDIHEILKSELISDAQTWILLDTSYEGSTDMKDKNPFAGLLEMPFVRTYEVVGRIPEECLAYYSDEQQQAIKKRQEAFHLQCFMF